MNDQQREAFEAYFLESRKSKHKPNFARLEDGTYADDHTQRHWWTWQQASLTQPQAQQAAAVPAVVSPRAESLIDRLMAAMLTDDEASYTQVIEEMGKYVSEYGKHQGEFALVPVVPTEEMKDAAGSEWENYDDHASPRDSAVAAYRAMIEAAPPAPVLPLSDERIKQLAVGKAFECVAFARAIESAHGITAHGAGGE